MTPENFAYWLRGFFELTKPESIGKDETAMIRAHLESVFQQDPGIAATAAALATPEPEQASAPEKAERSGGTKARAEVKGAPRPGLPSPRPYCHSGFSRNRPIC